MNDQPDPGEVVQPSPASPAPDNQGENIVWSVISTLVAGPAVWGGIGWAADAWLGSGRTFTAVGVVVGFITSLYIVYIKFGRD